MINGSGTEVGLLGQPILPFITKNSSTLTDATHQNKFQVRRAQNHIIKQPGELFTYLALGQSRGFLSIGANNMVNSSVCLLSLILCDPMDCSPPGSSVHGILLAKTGVACHTLLHGSSQLRDRTPASYVSHTGEQALHHWRHLGSPSTAVPMWK